MPGMGTAFGRGAVTILSSPWIVGGAVSVLFLLWIAAVLLGFPGPFSVLSNALALPPISTGSVDFTLIGSSASGSETAILATVGITALRGAIVAGFTGLFVDQLRGGSASGWSVVRAVRAIPCSIAITLAGFLILTIGQTLAPLLGGVGLLIQVALLVLGVYLFAFAPAIALTEDEGTWRCIGKSVRAARMPGSGNLSFAFLYGTASIVLLFVPKPGSELGVNPSISAWLVVLGASLFHLIFQAAFTYRYLCVAHEVPEAPPAPERPARVRRGRR